MRIALVLGYGVLMAGCTWVDGETTGAGSLADEPAGAAVVRHVDREAERRHAVDQIVGRWVYEMCDERGNCENVVRVYEETPDDGLVRYTELYDGTENEGFVGYDLETDGFVEVDYLNEWGSQEFERGYLSEEESIQLFGDPKFSGPEDRPLQWRITEDGQMMILRTGVGDVSERPSEFLGVIFSRVPLIGGGKDDD